MRQLVRNLVSRSLAAALVLLSFAVPAWATTYYVSPTGDGTAPTAGFATGFSTINGAIGDSRVVAGDTVILDKTTFVLANNVSVSKAITLCGAGENWETVLDGNKAKNMSSVSGATLHSFTLTNMGGQWAGEAGLKATGTTVSNLVFRQIGNLWTGNAGTRFPLTAKDGLVTHCWITNNVMPNNAGIKLSGSVVVENCYIADNVDRGCSGTESYRGIVLMDSASAILRNCTIVNNKSDYCAVYARVKDVQIYNNIIWGNTSGSGDGTFRLKDGVSLGTKIKNNCMTTVTGLPDSNFADDPLFQPDDLHLMSTSPCRGKADKTLSPPAFDIEGDPRGETPSVGCVEYKKSSSFTCLISPSTEYVEKPNEIVLSVTLDGSYAEPLTYDWDFDGDGTVDSTAAQPSLSQVGKYQVSVVVTDNAGKKASASYKNTLVVAPAGGFVVYVSPTGDGTAPYAGFATGFSSIQAAIDFSAERETVLLDKTTFELTESLTIDKKIVFRGAGENWETVLDGKASHTILVKATGALVHNLTFTNCGSQFNDGMGLTINNASVVSNVVSRQNGNAHTAGNSGARFVWSVEAGLVTHCWCTNNSAPGNAGFRIRGGTVENCYIADNIDRGLTSSYEERSGIVAIESGTLRNCTIVDNQSAYAGLYYRGASAKVYNNLIWGNTLVNSSEINNWMLKGTLSTANWLANCTTPLCGTAGNGNIASDPMLLDDRKHFARLSPCNGAANADQAPTFDIAGNPRLDPSIGAFEYEAGGFTCSIIASGATASQPEKVTLSCGLDGDHAEPLTYAWDLVGDGSVLSQGATAELSEIGVYRPKLTVTDANGKKATTAYAGSIVIYGEGGAVYVTSKGHATAKPPYATWETAATNVADVIVYAQSGNEVLLDAGMHLLTDCIDISTPITIRGAEGPDVTFVGHTNTTSRLFYLKNANAVLADFTVKDGDFRNISHGAIVKLDPGKVVNCRFIGNLVSGHGGVETTGAGSSVERCVFRGNVAEDKAQGPTCVKVAADSTIVRNCLFVGNTNLHANATVYYSGAAINMANGKSSVLNCTFVDNFTSNAQHAVICNDIVNNVLQQATVRNCVSTGNRRVVDGAVVDGNDIGANAAKQSDSIVWPTAFDYSAFTNVRTVDPLLNPATQKPRTGSPCINAGTLLDYTAESVDIEGNPRVYRFGTRYGITDLGCYETTYGVSGLSVLIR